jgi:peptidoglycan/xylan/chitin deacetylase (PgdA/CDA1 family)
VHQRSINLTFHGIGEPERRLDPGEQDVWVSGSQFLGVLDAVAANRRVQITFDDGNASDVRHALPALRERGLRATFFVVAGRLGAPGFLDDDGVRTLAASGMTVGCHGMRHRAWRRLDERELREELVEARRVLEAILERPVDQAACPFGSYDRRVLRSLRRSGYRRVYTSDGGPAHPEAWLQARTTVGPRDGVDVVDRIASGDRPPHRALRRRAKQVVKQWR